MKITDTIKYVGVNDHQVDLFEGQYQVPNGMSYNSYVIVCYRFLIFSFHTYQTLFKGGSYYGTYKPYQRTACLLY